MNQPFDCVYFVLSANSFHALGFSTRNSVIGISGQKLILLLKSIICSWALRAPGICLFKHSSHFQRGTTQYWQSKSMWAALKLVTTYFKIVLFLQPAGGKWGCETALCRAMVTCRLRRLCWGQCRISICWSNLAESEMKKELPLVLHLSLTVNDLGFKGHIPAGGLSGLITVE